MNKITPILLAGGSGKRLWPLSRKSYPKQFSNLLGGKTLFQQAALRLTSSDEISFGSHITLTSSDFRFIVAEQLQQLGLDTGEILIEPETKNTAPAILAASLFVYEKNPDAIMLVAPSDHVVPDVSAFHKVVKKGIEQVKTNKMVTFGISPTRPEIGYGYLELDENSLDIEGFVSPVLKFVEKPELNHAEQMLKSGNYLWNAGIFLFKAEDMIEAFENFQPELLKLTKKALVAAKADLDFLRLEPKYWKELKDESIDYAIMEKSENLVAIRFGAKWTDLGDWSAVWTELKNGSSNNAVSHNAHAIECDSSLLRSENVNQQLVGLGLKNIIAIAMPDAVLVASKDRSQDVKKIVDYLEANKIGQAESFPKDHRPWGWFESLVLGDTFQVKRIFLKPLAALSLQSHKYRSEHWIVVEGIAKVTVNEEIKMLNESQSIYVPQGAIHRLENPSDKPMILIEVQTGSYLGEDDIMRYEDIYSRK